MHPLSLIVCLTLPVVISALRHNNEVRSPGLPDPFGPECSHLCKVDGREHTVCNIDCPPQLAARDQSVSITNTVTTTISVPCGQSLSTASAVSISSSSYASTVVINDTTIYSAACPLACPLATATSATQLAACPQSNSTSGPTVSADISTVSLAHESVIACLMASPQETVNASIIPGQSRASYLIGTGLTTPSQPSQTGGFGIVNSTTGGTVPIYDGPGNQTAPYPSNAPPVPLSSAVSTPFEEVPLTGEGLCMRVSVVVALLVSLFWGSYWFLVWVNGPCHSGAPYHQRAVPNEY